MGRIGKLPISIPAEVKVTINNDTVRVDGPKGMLERKIPPLLNVSIEDNKIKVVPKQGPVRGGMSNRTWLHSHKNEIDALRGTIRMLINNMIIGVTQGYQKVLLIDGQGYRASLDGKSLELQIGYPHPIKFNPPEGIKIEVPSPQRIIVQGIDKQLVGDTAAMIRAFMKPEPYKGKGIRYEDEIIRRKQGKKAGYGATRA